MWSKTFVWNLIEKTIINQITIGLKKKYDRKEHWSEIDLIERANDQKTK